jgi:hypothetical protein
LIISIKFVWLFFYSYLIVLGSTTGPYFNLSLEASLKTKSFKNEVLTNPYINTSEIIAINLIKIFKDGPEVSLSGSPTVSPITAALCYSECFF